MAAEQEMVGRWGMSERIGAVTVLLAGLGLPIQRFPPAIGRTTTGIRASDTTC